MRFRQRHSATRNTNIMAPMIDVVFLLLIFFMLTLKVIPPEGDLGINMPTGVVEPVSNFKPELPELKIVLKADSDGNLQDVRFGTVSLGNDPEAAFDAMSMRVQQALGTDRGVIPSEEITASIHADYKLDYRWTLKASSTLMGRRDPSTGQVIRYINRVKIAPPVRDDV